MDLTISVKDSILNVRVVILAHTKNGYLFEKNPDGYLYFVGGRIKINETSEEAAKREFFEETGIKVDKVNFKTTLENFFVFENEKKFHEICFFYEVPDELKINVKEFKLVECPISEFAKTDIRPKIMKDYILSNDNKPHVIYKDYTKTRNLL